MSLITLKTTSWYVHSSGERRSVESDLTKDMPQERLKLILDDANIKVKQFIEESFAFGSEKLIIVTGKGIHSQNDKDPYTSQKLGILKYSVPDFLKNNLSLSGLIKEIAPARIEDGGEGAFYVYLRKKK